MRNKAQKFLKNKLPTRESIREHRLLRRFERLLDRPQLWCMNRRSVSMGAAIGIAWGCIPLPMHTIPAIFTALLLNGNVPVAILSMWLINPITMVPWYYFSYRLGLYVLAQPPLPFSIELSWSWVEESLPLIWQPFLLGCAICATTTALLAYTLVRAGWRLQVTRRWHKRQSARALATR